VNWNKKRTRGWRS